eukprot:gene8716-18022_t
MIIAIYGIMVYLYSFWAIAAMLSWSLNGSTLLPAIAPIFPWDVNGPEKESVSKSLIINGFWMLVFIIQHAIMARPVFKKIFNSILPKSTERSTYILLSSLIVHGLLANWHPIQRVIWSLPEPFFVPLLTLRLIGWVVVLLATFNHDHFNLFGIRQTTGFKYLVLYDENEFVTSFFYKYVRHPMMTGNLIGIWATDFMTLGQLYMCIIFTVFIVLDVIFLEEADLRQVIGEKYLDYSKQVPAFCPMPGMYFKGEDVRKKSK